MRNSRLVAATIAAVIAVSGLVAVTTPAQAAVNYCKVENLAQAGGMDALVKAAKAEKELNLIAIPRDWANYGEAIDLYSKAFGIKINSDNPTGSSAQEIAAIKTAPASKQPDVVDIGISVLPDALGIGRKPLFAPYKVASWNDIPTQWKDSTGLWYGDYYGVLALSYDASIPKAPKSIKEVLTDPAYKGMFAMGGDPTGSQQALLTLFAINAAFGGSATNLKPGIDALKAAKANGNYVPVLANAANFAAGAYKISIDWDFNGPGTIDTFKKAGVTLKYVVPTDIALQGTPYVQAVNAKAPHCASARLWQEFLYSQNKGKLTKDLTAADLKLSGSKLMKVIMGGQNIWALGAAHPITEVAMAKKKTLVAAPMGFGIPTTAKRVEPTSDQQVAQREFIATEWPKL